jgi:hypothetical protein
MPTPVGKRRAASVPIFQLQFEPKEIARLNERYAYNDDGSGSRRGKAHREGYLQPSAPGNDLSVENRRSRYFETSAEY